MVLVVLCAVTVGSRDVWQEEAQKAENFHMVDVSQAWEL